MTAADQPTTGRTPPLYYPPDLVKELTHQKIQEHIEEQVRQQIDESESSKWILRHPGAVLTMLSAVLIFGQWLVTQWMHEVQAPERERAEKQIRDVRKDIRTLTTFTLESQRYTSDALTDLARAQGVSIDDRPRELQLAENEARKLRNR